MATSYINTGVIGQYLGGTSLGSGGLTTGQQYQEFVAEVTRNRRSLSGPSQQEREAVRQRQQQRSQQSILDTQLVSKDPTTGEETVVREGVSVDTADVKVPTVPAKTPEEAAKVAAAPPPAPTITKQPLVAKPPPAPSEKAIAPERQYGQGDIDFVQAFERFYSEVQSKNASAVRSGRQALQSQYQAVLEAAQKSGRQDYISIAQQAGYGIANARDISAKNVGQAKAATATARTAIRGLVDLDTILKQNPLQQPVAAPTAPAVKVSTGRRGRVIF